MARDTTEIPRPECCGSRVALCCGGTARETHPPTSTTAPVSNPSPLMSWCCCGCSPLACPTNRETHVTKSVYILLLAGTTAVMGALMVPAVQGNLQAAFRDFRATCTDLNIGSNCLQLTGYMASYKVSFSISFFFLCMSLVTLGVSDSSTGARAYIHDGLWFIKVVVILSLIVATFVVPISHLDQLHTGWMYTCLAGNALFLVLQLLCLVNFSNWLCASVHSLASRSRWWKAVEVLSAIGVVSIWLVMSIVLFLTHGRQEFCLTKRLLLIFHTGICICLVLASLTPCTKGPSLARPGRRSSGPPRPRSSTPPPPSPPQQPPLPSTLYSSRLLQSGLVIVYVTYWLWSAMQSAPEVPGAVELSFLLRDERDLNCPGSHSPFVEDSLCLTSLIMMLFTVLYISKGWSDDEDDIAVEGRTCDDSTVTATTTTSEVCIGNSTYKRKFIRNRDPYVGSWGDIVEGPPPPCDCIAPPLPRRSLPPLPLGLEPINPPLDHLSAHGSLAESAPEAASKDSRSRDAFRVSHGVFHFILALATMFATAQTTKWFQPTAYHLEDLDRSWTAVGMKVGCAWCCALLYLVYLLVPNACRRRSGAAAAGNRGGWFRGGEVCATAWVAARALCSCGCIRRCCCCSCRRAVGDPADEALVRMSPNLSAAADGATGLRMQQQEII